MARREQPTKHPVVELPNPAVPEPTRTCLHCAYGFFDDGRFLINLMACWPTLVTCFNHVDHPGNLRLCTHRQNAYNSRTYRGTSKYKGVTYDPDTGKWRASINHGACSTPEPKPPTPARPRPSPSAAYTPSSTFREETQTPDRRADFLGCTDSLRTGIAVYFVSRLSLQADGAQCSGVVAVNCLSGGEI